MRKLTNNSIDICGESFTKEDIINIGRLQKQLLLEEGIYADFWECYNIWSGYSNDLAAGWLFFPANDEDILKQITSNQYFISFEHYIT